MVGQYWMNVKMFGLEVELLGFEVFQEDALTLWMLEGAQGH